MNRKVLSIAALVLLSHLLFGVDAPRFILVWDAGNIPFSYENNYQLSNIGFNSNLAAGFDFGSIVIEADAIFDYISMNGQDESNLLQGAFMNVGGSVNLGFNPVSWLDIKTGIGGLWQKSSFQYNGSGWLGLSQPGIVGILDIRFRPWEYLDIDLKNRLDAILAFDNSGSFRGVLPNYNGGIRATFRPGIRWLGIYMECDAFLWNFASTVTTASNWMLKTQVGCTLDFRFDGAKSSEPAGLKTLTKDEILNQEELTPKEKSDQQIKTAANVIGDPAPDPSLVAFAELKLGSEITFTDIVFEEGSDTMENESLLVLDKIADILSKKKTATILVSAYGLYTGDPMKDSALVRIRAVAIRNYLAKKGVATSRVKTSASGYITKKDANKPVQQKVTIKILTR